VKYESVGAHRRGIAERFPCIQVQYGCEYVFINVLQPSERLAELKTRLLLSNSPAPIASLEDGREGRLGLWLQDERNDIAGRWKSGATANVFLEYFKMADLPLRN
jgi:hypothetical protein